MGGLTPIPDVTTGAPTCPIGYTYDPASQLCQPNPTAPINMNDPVIQKTVLGMADAEIDPHAQFQAGAEGLKDSGLIERFWAAFFMGVPRFAEAVIGLIISLLDTFYAKMGELFFAAQAQRTAGYYELSAALMKDLLGIDVDGAALYADFQAGGRLKSMVSLGGSLFNMLASEFAGVPQETGANEFVVAPGTGIGGLPAKPLTPAGGVAAAQGFLGFMTAFAVREGNTDYLADAIPYGLGHAFKDFATDFTKNVGLGRLGRVALRPLVQTMIATPLQWAMNQQYRPALLSVGEAYRAWTQGLFTADDLNGELATHGYSDKRAPALQWQNLEKPTRHDLRLLHAAGAMADSDYAVWMGRLGYTPETTAALDQADDLRPARLATLQAAESFALQYMKGKITRVQFSGAIDSIKNTLNGVPLLTSGEVTALNSLPSIAGAAPRRHLSVTQLNHMYIDGLITLGEFTDSVTALGYDADAVTELQQELLILAKKAADKAAAAAAKAAAAAAKAAGGVQNPPA